MEQALCGCVQLPTFAAVVERLQSHLTHAGTTKGITIDHIFVRRHGGEPGARHAVMDVVRYEVGTNIDPKIEGELITDHRPVTVDVCPRP